MIQLLDGLDMLISVDENLSLLQEFVVNAAAKGRFGIADKIFRDNFKTEELDPMNWEIVKIEEIAEFTNGYAFKSSDYRDDGIGIIRMSDLKYGEISVQQLKYVSESFLSELSSALQVKPNDLVIGMSGSIGRPCFNRTEKTFLLNQRVGKLTPNLGLVSPEYLAISLASLEQHFLQISMGSAIKNLSTVQIKQAKILLPPLAIQKSIVTHYEKFSSLTKSLKASFFFEKNAALKFRNSSIDAISTAQTPEELQNSWERIQGNWEVIAGTPEAIDAVRTLILDLAVQGQIAPHDQSGISAEELITESIRMANKKKTKQASDNQEAPFQIPKHWKWCTLQEITEDLGQETPVSEFSYIDVASIDNKTGTISKDLNILSAKNAPSRARKRVVQGSVLYSTVRPYLRNIAIIDREFTPQAIASTAFAVLHPIKSVSPVFLFFCLRSNYFKSFVESKQKGVAYPAINGADLKSALLPIPPMAEQEQIIQVVTKLLNLCDQLEGELSQKVSLGDKFSRSITAITGQG